MTFQDHPLSRREIREREAEAARAAGTDSAPAPAGADAHASEAPEHRGSHSMAPLYESVAPAVGTAEPEPLTYVTQGRSPLPQYDAPVAGTTAAPAAQNDAGFRYRDFSPEGRRASRSPWLSSATESSDLEYRTQGRDEVSGAATPSVAPVQSVAPVAEAPANIAPVTEVDTPVAEAPATPMDSVFPYSGPIFVPGVGTMTRRELRAMREAEQRAAEAEESVADETPSPSDAPVMPSVAPAASAAPVMPSVAPVAPVTPEAAPAASVAPSVAPVAPSAAPVFSAAPSVAPAAPAASAAPVVAPSVAPISAPSVAPVVSGAPAFPAEPTAFTPPPLIEPQEPAPDALASFDALFRSDTATPPPVVSAPSAAPVAPSVTESAQPVAPVAQPSVHPVAEPVAPAPVDAPAVLPEVSPFPTNAVPIIPSAPSFADYAAGRVPPSPFEQVTLAGQDTTFAAPVAPPAPEAPPAPSFAAPFAPAPEVPSVPTERPMNHWSRQAELDDEAQPATGSLQRSVGYSSVTSNALVLPEIPNPEIIISPVTSTGDTLVTGSITLPSSLSSTGALPTQVDESDLDGLLEAGDGQVVSTDSQPVRAIRAVSTHTSSRELIGNTKPQRGSRALTALIVAAVGMAVVVVTLLVVAVASGSL